MSKTGWARAAIWLLAPGLTIGSAAAARPKNPPPFTGELRLDMAVPVIELMVGDVSLRLRVALDQKRLIELNPAAVDRIAARPPARGFRFEPGFDALVGRERLKGIQAPARVTINRRAMLVALASHGRDCCAGVDGEIGIGLLPYATIRFQNAGTDGAGHRRADFMIDDNSEHGPETRLTTGADEIFVQFSLHRTESVATASAGAQLARQHGGRLEGRGATVAAFGIERPVATLNFPHPVDVAGFAFRQIPVRTADFGGRLSFPADPSAPQDIVVSKKVPRQLAWPVILIARDRLEHCSEIRFDGNRRQLTLFCPVEGGA